MEYREVATEMLNKGLQYMMSNDPSETLSEKGEKRRKKLRPLLLFLLKLSNKQKLTVEKCWFDASLETRPIVYVCSHGFKDDCQNMLVSARPEGYLIFGNIDLYFNTFDGTIAWLYGSQLINRYNRVSRRAMKAKMDRIFEVGSNVIIFPEATWNLSPNKPMLGLHWGFYETAVKNNAVIVPVLTHKVGKNCYSRILSSIDPKEVWKDEIDSIYIMMKKYLDKARDLIIYKSDEADIFNECFNILYSKLERFEELLNEINEKTNYLNGEDVSLSVRAEYINNNEYLYKKIYDLIDNIELVCDHYKRFLDVYLDIENDSIEYDAYILAKKIIGRVGSARKEVVVKYVRDVMALEKVDMFRTHPDYSYMQDGTDMYEAWDKYVEDTLKGTPYFYPEEEKKSEFKDPLVQDIDEVMPWLADNYTKVK